MQGRGGESSIRVVLFAILTIWKGKRRAPGLPATVWGWRLPGRRCGTPPVHGLWSPDAILSGQEKPPLWETLHLWLRRVLPSFCSSFAHLCIHSTYVQRRSCVSGTKPEPGVRERAAELLLSRGLRPRGR